VFYLRGVDFIKNCKWNCVFMCIWNLALSS